MEQHPFTTNFIISDNFIETIKRLKLIKVGAWLYFSFKWTRVYTHSPDQEDHEI